MAPETQDPYALGSPSLMGETQLLILEKPHLMANSPGLMAEVECLPASVRHPGWSQRHILCPQRALSQLGEPLTNPGSSSRQENSACLFGLS